MDCLLVLQNTLEEIGRNSEKPKGLIYRPLKDLNNLLLGTLPNQLQNSARRRLEIRILDAEQKDLSAEILDHSRGRAERDCHADDHKKDDLFSRRLFVYAAAWTSDIAKIPQKFEENWEPLHWTFGD